MRRTKSRRATMATMPAKVTTRSPTPAPAEMSQASQPEPKSLTRRLADAVTFAAFFGAFTACTWGPLMLIFGTDLPWWGVIIGDLAVFAGVTLLLAMIGLIVDFADSPA